MFLQLPEHSLEEARTAHEEVLVVLTQPAARIHALSQFIDGQDRIAVWKTLGVVLGRFESEATWQVT